MKNIALIDIGKMGMSHLAIANQTTGINVKAICDTSKPLLRMIEKNTKFASYTDYKKMIDEENLDVVHICTPHYMHAPIAIYAAKNKVNVYQTNVCYSTRNLT